MGRRGNQKRTEKAKMIKKVKPTEKETVMNGMMQYANGKPHVQLVSRAFLAGVKFYKEQVLNKIPNETI